ncbi:antifreeze protein [Rubellimicrobium arenae]|uniref:antifreeze protein n=1 Tax=Rubellimicrobium arenae TaxID=2817372 RepID=UPI001B3159E1|nr:antifreeze protein [Rubellimicrobium arenae]
MNSYQPWRSAFAFWSMMAQAQTVVTLRMWGMMGLLPASKRENHTMVSEKAPAFAKAAVAAGAAAMAGKSPDQIAAAAIRPIKRRTSSNVKRLTKPKRPPLS